MDIWIFSKGEYENDFRLENNVQPTAWVANIPFGQPGTRPSTNSSRPSTADWTCPIQCHHNLENKSLLCTTNKQADGRKVDDTNAVPLRTRGKSRSRVPHPFLPRPSFPTPPLLRRSPVVINQTNSMVAMREPIMRKDWGAFGRSQQDWSLETTISRQESPLHKTVNYPCRERADAYKPGGFFWAPSPRALFSCSPHTVYYLITSQLIMWKTNKLKVKTRSDAGLSERTIPPRPFS